MAEYGYRQLISNKNFLKVRLRARQLMKDGTDLVAILYKEKRLIFKTASGTYGRRVIWTQTVEITDAGMENLLKARNFNDVETLIKNSGLKVYCNCLAKGTRVLTKEGYKNIEDVLDTDFVLGSDSKWHKVVTVLKSDKKKNWYSVKARGVRDDLKVSEDHKLLFSTYRDTCSCGCGRSLRSISDKTRMAMAFQLYDKRLRIPKHFARPVADGFQRYQLHALKDYKLGELLCTPVYKGSGVQFDVDYARMLGYYLAEGSMQKKGSEVHITLNQNEEHTIADDIKAFFESRGVRVRYEFQEADGNKWLTVHIYSKQFKKDCDYYCGQKSATKRVHTDVLEWCEAAKEAFLIGHLLGDGAVDDSFRWLSTSKDLVDMLQLLLSSLGICAATYIADNEKGNHRTCYAVSAAINKFYPIYAKYKHLFRDKDIITTNNSVGQNDVDVYSLHKVLSITPIEEQEGYDIVLADDPHTYLANNVFVSNCPAFTFWGFKYLSWKKGYGLVREVRRPKVRNPHEEGYICKHLYLVLSLYPFWSKALAKKFKDWATAKEGAMSSQSIKFDTPRQNRYNRQFVQQHPEPEVINEDEIELELEP